MEGGSCAIEFGCPCFPEDGGELYSFYSQQLKCAVKEFSTVFVVLRCGGENLEFAVYERMLTHLYATLAQGERPECNVVVVDPSLAPARLVKEQPWSERLSCVSAAVAAVCDAAHLKVLHVDAAEPVCAREKFPRFCPVLLRPRYEHGVNGGTFDRLHNGHRILLAASLAASSCSLTVGITSDKMIAQSKKELKELIQTYDERMQAVDEFLRLCNPDVERRLPSIDDAFGPSIEDARLQVIIVSEETQSGGGAVNEKRKERGLSVLSILVVDCWDRHAKEKKSIGEKISSTNARRSQRKSGRKD